MQSSRSPSSARHQAMSAWEPAVLGTIYGLLSAIGYTGANICLRALTDCDPAWVSCVKAIPTVLLVGPWLIVIAHRGERILPPPKVFWALVISGLLGQLAGNVIFQWSLGVIGLALCVPLLMGVMIIAGGILGRVFLGEGVTPRAAVAILILIISIFVLSLGAGDASLSVAAGSEKVVSSALVLVAVAAACMTGLAYAVLGVVIRYGVSGKASLSVTLVIVALAGVFSLGPLSYWRIGIEGMQATAWDDLALMLLAGVCNAAAFLALTKALQLTTVVYVHAINILQTTFAAIAGVLFFQEALTGPMLVGVALTIFGLMLMKQRKKSLPQDETSDALDRGEAIAGRSDEENAIVGELDAEAAQ